MLTYNRQDPSKILTAALTCLIPPRTALYPQIRWKVSLSEAYEDRREVENYRLTTREVWSSGLRSCQSTLHCLLEVLPRSLLLCVHAINWTCSHSLRLSKWWQWGLFGWLRGERSHSCCWGTFLFGGGKDLFLARRRTYEWYRNSLLYLLGRMRGLLCRWFLFVPHSYGSQRQLLWVSIQLSIRKLQMTGLTKIRQVYLFWFSRNRWRYLCYIFIGCLKEERS